MLKKIGLVSLILAWVGVTVISANFAAVSTEQWGVIMNLSGRQRMLSQKMTKEALLATSGINAEENRKNLKETMNTFEKVLKGLRDGDASLNLPACENEEITAKLDKINLLFDEMIPLLSKVTEGGVLTPVELPVLAKLNLPILTTMDSTVKMFEQEAGKVLTKDPALALVINLAGKQRMLTQKMSKEALLMYLKIDMVSNSKMLRDTASLFDRTLKGLKDGDSELGLPINRDEGIISQLDLVGSFWSAVKPLVEKTSNMDNYVSKEETAAVVELLSTILKEMDKAVKMYEALSK
ncbi:MAG: type IV pili methyl-accepting chemotaxis transducer N-terminal domain-containing protein [Candidatus Omnitrophota bacterium]|nr:type IV pili methyl-accepting chemotaxis transducer N-terminal domain-containing protein [Candidatus Omnitrophota bacterium]